MATKALATSTKLANLQQLKKDRIAKIEAQLAVQQTQLLQKRKDELFNIFKSCNALTIDDRLLMSPFGDQKSLAFRRREDIMKLL